MHQALSHRQDHQLLHPRFQVMHQVPRQVRTPVDPSTQVVPRLKHHLTAQPPVPAHLLSPLPVLRVVLLIVHLQAQVMPHHPHLLPVPLYPPLPVHRRDLLAAHLPTLQVLLLPVHL